MTFEISKAKNGVSLMQTTMEISKVNISVQLIENDDRTL